MTDLSRPKVWIRIISLHIENLREDTIFGGWILNSFFFSVKLHSFKALSELLPL